MDHISQISTLSTEDISAHALTETADVQARLVIPAGVTVRDLSGREVNTVSVHLLIEKTEAVSQPSASVSGTTAPSAGPR